LTTSATAKRRCAARRSSVSASGFGLRASGPESETARGCILTPRLRLILLTSALLCAIAYAQSAPQPSILFLGLDQARPALSFLGNLVPAELRAVDSRSLDAFWPAWVREHDAAIRARLIQGDEDSLVNLLLFGTSFTRQPRITARQIETASGEKLDALTGTRVDDLVSALVRPGDNERLVFARKILEARGIAPATPGGRVQARAHLLGELGRVLKEFAGYARVIEEAARLPVPGEAFARRSGLYRTRGLSSDTSLAPNFAIEETLKQIRAKGLLGAPVRRIAIVGPGLDFTDKLEGYDFYPQQTVQPFAIIDTLLRLRLADPGDFAVTTFDLSPRVNAHLDNVKKTALEGRPYVVQLPLDDGEHWSAGMLRYWAAFGDRIGAPVKPVPAPASAGTLKLRAVSVRADVASRLAPVDANIVLQRLDLPVEMKFDLVIGTNVFLYYDEFQQALAMANIERMLRPGGLLLSNNALVDLPSSSVRYVGSTTLAYSDRKDNGDTIVWYQCAR
jgi:SAM-dependent methyltransferase